MIFTVTGLLSVLVSVLAEDWLAGAAICVLVAAWRYLRTPGRPPVIQLAFTFQWVQVVLGIYYYALTGRVPSAMYLSDYRPMVVIGLGCLLALLAGLWIGLSLLAVDANRAGERPAIVFSWPALVLGYVGLTFATGTIQHLAWEITALTQGILALTLVRMVLLFFMIRRLTWPRVRWGWIGAVLLGETLLGFTGYFAGFREPLMLAAVAMLEIFDARQVRHWLLVSALGIVIVTAGAMWMAVRSEYRRDLADEVAASRSARLGTIASLSAAWLQSDADDFLSTFDVFVERLWAIYYPALAVARVPSMLPHEHGTILLDALTHLLTPRLFFPDKVTLLSDSEMVRYYSGVRVAGPEQGTSIAFGYATESYVDFGIPLMFVPVLAYGVLLGSAYQWLLRVVWHRELAIALATVLLWQSLYSFERSWARHLGLFVTLILYLGGAAIVVDRVLSWTLEAKGGRAKRRDVTPAVRSVDS